MSRAAARGKAERAQEREPRAPRGELQIRTGARPADTNQNGDIFGGWVLGQMDVAGGIFAASLAQGRVVTVAVDGMTFKKPVYVGDVVCVYAELIDVGTTSMTVWVETWVLRRNLGDRVLVTEGKFTYVHIDARGRPQPLRAELRNARAARAAGR